MRFLPLLLGNLRRRKLRTLFTLLSILVAFILYGYLAAITTAFEMGIDMTGADRLVLRHKVSLVHMLPERYGMRVRMLPGVRDLAHATWFGGIYQDPKNFFAQMAVEPQSFLRIYPEYRLSPADADRWLSTRTGAIVGRKLAERYGWHAGDQVPLIATYWRRKDESQTWTFTIAGIYDGAEQGTDTTQMFFRYDYFDEARAYGQGLVGWYVVQVAAPEQAVQVAARIDEEFANSQDETKTSTEKAFIQAFAKQVGDIGAIMAAVLAVVFFTILLVAGNTMAQSVRERINELAVLKSLGFSDVGVMLLVLGESLTLAVGGGGVGLAIGWWLIRQGDPTDGALPMFYLPTADLVLGAVYVVVLGLAAGTLPAVQALRLQVAEALRRG